LSDIFLKKKIDGDVSSTHYKKILIGRVSLTRRVWVGKPGRGMLGLYLDILCFCFLFFLKKKLTNKISLNQFIKIIFKKLSNYVISFTKIKAFYNDIISFFYE
jgi:hypothetical protein